MATKGYLMLLGGMREIERILKERMHEDEETIEQNGVCVLVESMADQIDELKEELKTLQSGRPLEAKAEAGEPFPHIEGKWIIARHIEGKGDWRLFRWSTSYSIHGLGGAWWDIYGGNYGDMHLGEWCDVPEGFEPAPAASTEGLREQRFRCMQCGLYFTERPLTYSNLKDCEGGFHVGPIADAALSAEADGEEQLLEANRQGES